MFGEGLGGTVRFALLAIAIVVTVTMCCEKCHALEVKYLIPHAEYMTDGVADEAKMETIMDHIAEHYVNTHYHKGEIQMYLFELPQGMLLVFECECKEVSCESDNMPKVQSKNRLHQTNSG